MAVVLPAASAALTSGQVIISNSTSGAFAPAAACLAAAGLAAGACANAVAADSASTGIDNIKRRMTSLLIFFEVFQLSLRLSVGWIELDRLLERGNRPGLVTFGVLDLSDRGIGAHRLRVILDVDLQIGERVVRLAGGVGALRHRQHRRLAEVVALTGVELVAQLLEPGDARGRPARGG